MISSLTSHSPITSKYTGPVISNSLTTTPSNGDGVTLSSAAQQPGSPVPAAGQGVPAAQTTDATWIPGPEFRLEETPSTVALIGTVIESFLLNTPLLLTGPPGVGKTSVINHLAGEHGYPVRRVNLDNNTDEIALFGGYKPGPDGGFRWVDGDITEAARKGHWLIMDEINKADGAVLARIYPMLDGDGFLVLNEKDDKERVKVHPDFRVFATENPASDSGSKELSTALFSRFQRKRWVDRLPAGEVSQIVQKKVPGCDMFDGLALATFDEKVSQLSRERTLGKKGGPYTFSLREVHKLAGRIKKSQSRSPELKMRQHMWLAARDVYAARFMNPDDRKVVEDLLGACLGQENRPPQPTGPAKITRQADSVQVGQVKLPLQQRNSPFVPKLEEAALPATPRNVARLEQVAMAVESDEPLSLVGPTGAGKTSLVRWLAAETGNEFQRVNLSNYTDTTHLIGGYYPSIDPQTKKPIPGKFEWQDGVVVEAMKKGQWLVLDENNMADPGVLAALHPLLEPGRTLVLKDHEGEKVKAHPNFRIFTTGNPPTAEYAGAKDSSEAWRNRFTEVWTPGVTEADENREILAAYLQPMQMVNPNGQAVDKTKLAKQMVELHDRVKAMAERGPDGSAPELTSAKKDGYKAFTLRELKAFAQYMQGLMGSQGADLDGATEPDPQNPDKQVPKMVDRDLKYVFRSGAMAYYGEGLRDPKDRDKIAKLAKEKANGL